MVWIDCGGGEIGSMSIRNPLLPFSTAIIVSSAAAQPVLLLLGDACQRSVCFSVKVKRSLVAALDMYFPLAAADASTLDALRPLDFLK